MRRKVTKTAGEYDNLNFDNVIKKIYIGTSQTD